MTLRGRLKSLEEGMRGHLESFVLEDGSRHYYNPTSGELFLFSVECVRIQGTGKPWPETPEPIKAIAKARDRREAFEQVPTGGLFPFDKDALVERGELVRRSLIYDQTLDDADPGDLSEP
jgi:hypothetical protein